MEVRRLLKVQMLRHFLEMSRKIYPDLVNVFYTNLQFKGDTLLSRVKGVDLEITNEVWIVVTGLKFSGQFKAIYSNIDNCESLQKKVLYLIKTVDKLSKQKSNFETMLASQYCVFGKFGLGYPQSKNSDC